MASVIARSVAFLALGASATALEGASVSCAGEDECGRSDASSMLQLRSGSASVPAGEVSSKAAGANLPRKQCGEEFTTFPYIQAALWGTSYDGWEKCSGREQSPIDLYTQDKPRWSSAIEQNYGEGGPDLRVKNNGHALQVDGSFGDVALDGRALSSAQFHFHHPSEHTIGGHSFPLEMHIVNADTEANLGVVGVIFDLGAPNDCLAEVLSEPAPRAGCNRWVGEVDLGCFHEQLTGSFWAYNGSLTTPPCTEGVAWRVMATRATISPQQLDVMKSRFTMNARPTQARIGHDVTLNYVL